MALPLVAYSTPISLTFFSKCETLDNILGTRLLKVLAIFSLLLDLG